MKICGGFASFVRTWLDGRASTIKAFRICQFKHVYIEAFAYSSITRRKDSFCTFPACLWPRLMAYCNSTENIGLQSKKYDDWIDVFSWTPMFRPRIVGFSQKVCKLFGADSFVLAPMQESVRDWEVNGEAQHADNLKWEEISLQGGRRATHTGWSTLSDMQLFVQIYSGESVPY